MHTLPKIKENLLVQDLADEILIYDQSTERMFCLNATARRVFNACDGSSGFAALKRSSNFTDDLIYLTLDELNKQNLLADDYASAFTGISRREAIKKVGLGTLAALPVITGLTTPVAAQSASRCIPFGAGANPCTGDNGQQGNCCDGLRCFDGRCQRCLARGDSYAFIFSGGSVAACNARTDLKSQCCNPDASATYADFECMCG